MEKYKVVNRNIRFDSRALSSPYRCKYGDKNDFEILRVTCTYGSETRVYEVESKYLPGTDSIRFKAFPDGDSFTIEWGPTAIRPYVKRVQ